MLLCLRCGNGDVTLRVTEAAFQLRISNEEMEQTKATLIENGLIDDGLLPTAWDRRQYTSDSSAARVARYRERMKRPCNVTEKKCNALETETETETEIKKKRKGKNSDSKRFTPPTDEQVAEYCRERGNKINPAHFCAYYESRGWRIGNAPMKSWQAAVRTWEQRDNGGSNGGAHQQIDRRSRAQRVSDTLDEIARADIERNGVADSLD
jgi:hypothetical protein